MLYIPLGRPILQEGRDERETGCYTYPWVGPYCRRGGMRGRRGVIHTLG